MLVYQKYIKPEQISYNFFLLFFTFLVLFVQQDKKEYICTLVLKVKRK